VVLVALIGGVFALIKGAQQRKHETLTHVIQNKREDRLRLQQRLTQPVKDLITICGDLEVLASHLINSPDQGLQQAPQAIRDARRGIDQIHEAELKAAKDELIAINGRIVQWYGIKAGLLADAQANRQSNHRRGDKVDELEVEVATRLTAVRGVLEAALAELNR
jgi:hypothetical protein